MKFEISEEVSNAAIWITIALAVAAILISLIFGITYSNQGTKQKIADAKTCEQAVILEGGSEMGVALKLSACASLKTKTITSGQ